MTNANYTPIFDWAIVELFGHQRIVGQLGEQQIGGETFIRVDVPATGDEETDLEGFTKLYGKGAIYAITPVDEATAILAIKGLQVKPVEVWRLNIPQLTTQVGLGS